jgi:hypothetical protein
MQESPFWEANDRSAHEENLRVLWDPKVHYKSHDSSVGIALGYGLDNRNSRFDSRRGLEFFLFTTASRTALGPTQPPIQWAPGALFLGVKRSGREANHSPPFGAEVKEWVELYLHSPIRLLAWCSVKAQGRFITVFTKSRHSSYPQPDEFTPHLHILVRQVPFRYYSFFPNHS